MNNELIVKEECRMTKFVKIGMYSLAGVMSLLALIFAAFGSIKVFDMDLSFRHLISFFGATGYLFKNDSAGTFFKGLLAYIFWVIVLVSNVFFIKKSIKHLIAAITGKEVKSETPIAQGESKTEENKNDEKPEQKKKLFSGMSFSSRNVEFILFGVLTSLSGLSKLGKTGIIVMSVGFVLNAVMYILVTNVTPEGKIDYKNAILVFAAFAIKTALCIVFLFLIFKPNALDLSFILKYVFKSFDFLGLISSLILFAKMSIAAEALFVIDGDGSGVGKGILGTILGIFVLRLIQSLLGGGFAFFSALWEVLPLLLLSVALLLLGKGLKEEINVVSTRESDSSLPDLIKQLDAEIEEEKAKTNKTID